MKDTYNEKDRQRWAAIRAALLGTQVKPQDLAWAFIDLQRSGKYLTGQLDAMALLIKRAGAFAA